MPPVSIMGLRLANDCVGFAFEYTLPVDWHHWHHNQQDPEHCQQIRDLIKPHHPEGGDKHQPRIFCQGNLPRSCLLVADDHQA